MTEIVEVDGEWLDLREAEDARARSRDLAAAAARGIGPGPVVVHDLGSGTGSMMRWLAPLLPGPQTWVLHDWNPALTARAAAGAAPLDGAGRPVAIRPRTGELVDLAPGDLGGASLVTASALLDVLTEAELAAVVRACVAAACPVLLSLSVTGDVRLQPAEPLDGMLAAAFDAHQRRALRGRRLLGPDGAAAAARGFREAGWTVRTADTGWRLGAHDPRLLAEWLDGWVSAAVEQRPQLGPEAADYLERRIAQLRAGGLDAVVAHVDLLARPR